MDERKEIYVLVEVTKSAYINMKVVADKPDAWFMGRMVTKATGVQVFTRENFDETTRFAIMGRVARNLVDEGKV